MNKRTLIHQKRILETSVSVREILAYLETDRFLDLKETSRYLSLSVRMIRDLLDEIPHFRIGSKKLLFKKSELDTWMLGHREGGSPELDQLVNDAVTDLLGDR